MRALPESHMSDIKNVEMGEKASELVPSDTRQGKDIQYAGGADTTQEDAPAPTQEGGGEPATTASDPPETQASKTPEDLDLDLLLDIPLELKVELGRARIKIHKLLKLAPGSAVKLIKLETPQSIACRSNRPYSGSI